MDAFEAALGVLEALHVEGEEGAVENGCRVPQPPDQQLQDPVVEQNAWGYRGKKFTFFF